MASNTDAARNIFTTGLHNAHALEQQALQIMNRQVERLENYPELEQLLRRHIQETEQQRVRLEEVMSQLAESPSSLKEAVQGFMGNAAAIAHSVASDEIIKNMLANTAFENYEIASYKSLLVMGEAAGFNNLTGLRQSLDEEVTMARQVADLVEPITRKYIEIGSRGEAAKI
ncbi:ferritin-like domain-containing protein [Skermanella mucosa]|uniref:ferritin-like domain-containing protein n=1 Tax=Skermanella mucosa TaxID=1789672 RepID=UPI00192C513F|nr:ferritin-like domain-containing protein [Skermanella mucosa]UEM20760.1 ferritin-like domain-containing protein [Skermanella mucosa]